LLGGKLASGLRVKGFLDEADLAPVLAPALVAGFLVAGFLVAGFLAAGFLVAGFLAAGFLAGVFLAPVFLVFIYSLLFCRVYGDCFIRARADNLNKAG
jgi:hypothetical protein